MANCNGCLKADVSGFCTACQRKLFDRSKVNHKLTFNWEDISKRIDGQPMGFSISGVQRKGFIAKPRGIDLQPKMALNEKSSYILKPILSRFELPDEAPANEHFTMQLAKQVFGLKTAECALLYFSNGRAAYLCKRFDYDKNGEKLNQEDFASVLQAENKYTSKSYQAVGEWLNPLDRVSFLQFLIFNFLTGNGDVHLKNISLLETADGDMILSPAYDLLNTKIHVKDNAMALNLFEEMEQTSLPLGSKYPYSAADFIEFGERMGIRPELVSNIIQGFLSKEKEVYVLLKRSFLSPKAQKQYKTTLKTNYQAYRKKGI